MAQSFGDWLPPRGDRSRSYAFFSSLEVGLAMMVMALAVLGGVGMVGILSFSTHAARLATRVPHWAMWLAPWVWIVSLAAGLKTIDRFAGDAGKPLTHPLATSYALNRTLNPSRVVRCATAGWWLLFGGALILVAAETAARLDANADLHLTPLDEVIFQLALHAGTALAVNVTLLIAFYHLTGSERLIRRLASFRLAFDIVLVGALTPLTPHLQPFDI